MQTITTLLLVAAVSLPVSAQPQARPLAAVQTIAVSPTVVSNPERVKEPSAAQTVEQSLRTALARSGFQIGDGAVRAHIELEEFTGGSAAKRSLLGFGSGRATVSGRLVVSDASGSELASVPIKVRGRVLFSGYHNNDTQRRQASESFEKRLAEALATLR